MGLLYILRKRKTCNHICKLMEKYQFWRGIFLDLGGVMIGSHTSSMEVQLLLPTVTLNLPPFLRGFRGIVVPHFFFIYDNATPYHTVAVEELLKSKDIQLMEWSAIFTDLNHIQHVWNFLRWRVAAHNHTLITISNLWLGLQQECSMMREEYIHNDVLSNDR